MPSAWARPTPISASSLPRSRRPASSGGILEARVIAGEGDELDRLAEGEGVGALHDVARRGVGDAGQRADLARAVGGQVAR